MSISSPSVGINGEADGHATKENPIMTITKKSVMLASVGLATVLMGGVFTASASAVEPKTPLTASSESTKSIPGIDYSNGTISVTMTKSQTWLLGNAIDVAEFAVGDLGAAAAQLCAAIPIPFGPTVCHYLVNRTLGSWIPQIKEAASEYQCVQISGTIYAPFPPFWTVARVPC